MTEYIPTFLMWIMGITGLGFVILKIRHTNRFGKNRGPMPRRIGNFLLWTSMIAFLALMFWETQHGIFHLS
jgi:uncharacterized membrane protein YecN with MAPEG domain